MIRNPVDVVEALRREGPGALPLTTLSQRLRDRGSDRHASEARLREQIQDANGALRILEFPTPHQGDGPGPALDAWVLVTADERPPDADPLVVSLWETLRLLATKVDPESPVSLSRWMLKANEAVGLFSLLRQRGPPPTTLPPRPLVRA